jgi:TRAP-type mannitol/chloroaromatic compound transport system permease small subunit
MQALKVFIRIVERLNTWIGVAVSVLLPAMAIALTYEVVARYLFRRPTIWAYDMAIFMFGYCGLLAGAYVLMEKAHVNVDIIYMRLSRRGKAAMDVITGLLFFFFIILVIIYGWKAAIFALELGKRTNTEWAPPVGHFRLMIPVGAFLLLLQGLANWIRDLYLVITNKELEG